MNVGWVRIYRQIEDNFLWLSEPFTKGQAWLDLIIFANHQENSFFIRGVKVDIKRGQIGWSELTMAKRWHWSRNKVRRFIKMLKTEQQIEQQKSRITTIITIINYDKFQENDTTKGHQTIQQKDIRRYTNNNDNNDKNDKKEIRPSSKLDYLLNLPEEDIKRISSKLGVEPTFINSKAEDLYNYCKAKGRVYKDYYAFLLNAVKRDKPQGRRVIKI